MNARPVKTTIALCLLSLSPLTSTLHAQDTNVENSAPIQSSPGRRGPNFGGQRGINVETLPIFNIQIENGQLLLAPLKDHQNPWTATLDSSVPATMDNLSKYLRAIDTNLNIVLSPDVGNITIPNLKLNTRNVIALHEAIAVASGNAIFDNSGSPGFGFVGSSENKTAPNLTFVSARSHTRPSVEVFNLSGYIQSLGKVDDKVVVQKLDELKEIIAATVRDQNNNDTSAELPNFKFHSGTKLFIVIGKPEAIEVTRKIINALSGQQPSAKTNPALDTPPPSDQN